MRSRSWVEVIALVAGLLALPGCAVVTVAGLAAGAAVGVATTVVGAGVTVAGKVVGAGVDAITPGPAHP